MLTSRATKAHADSISRWSYQAAFPYRSADDLQAVCRSVELWAQAVIADNPNHPAELALQALDQQRVTVADHEYLTVLDLRAAHVHQYGVPGADTRDVSAAAS